MASTAGSDICVCDLGWRGDNCSNMSSHFHERCPVRESCLFLSVLLQPHEENERPLTACERQAGFYGECGQCKEACDMFTTCSGHGRCRGKTACDCGENVYVIFVLIFEYLSHFMVTAFQMVVAYRMQYLWYETTIPRAWCPVSNGGVGWQYRLAVWSGTTISNCDFEGQYPMGILRESA